MKSSYFCNSQFLFLNLLLISAEHGKFLKSSYFCNFLDRRELACKCTVGKQVYSNDSVSKTKSSIYVFLHEKSVIVARRKTGGEEMLFHISATQFRCTVEMVTCHPCIGGCRASTRTLYRETPRSVVVEGTTKRGARASRRSRCRR